MKNIYIFDDELSSSQNGIGTFLTELIKTTNNLKVNQIVLNSSAKEFNSEDTDNGVKKIRIPHFHDFSLFKHHSIVITLLRLEIKDSLDNIFMINHSPCSGMVRQLRRFFPLSEIVFVIHDQGWTSYLHGNVNEFERIILNKSNYHQHKIYGALIRYFEEEKEIYNLVDRIICLSEDTKSLLLSLYNVDENKISITKNKLTDVFKYTSEDIKKEIKKELYCELDEKIILCVGRIQSSKGCDVLLSAFYDILKEYPKCRLVMIGMLYNPDFFLSSSQLFSTRVSFTGQLSKSELKKWYKIADIGVIPSYTEQCSYTAIEMMMHGLPIVASDGWGVRKMFVDNYNAIIAPIVDYNNPIIYKENLANATIKILNSVNIRNRLSKNARQYFIKEYKQTQDDIFTKI